jgi:hypothetical protein
MMIFDQGFKTGILRRFCFLHVRYRLGWNKDHFGGKALSIASVELLFSNHQV